MMPHLQMSLLSVADLDDLFVFESENRAYFEANVQARAACYYSPDGVKAAFEAALLEREKGLHYQFIGRDAGGHLVLRVNLSRIRRAHFNSAELGYRVAQNAGRQGYASSAVEHALRFAFDELKLRRVEAIVRENNLGSLKIMQRSGFSPYGRSTQSFELQGVLYDLLHFELHDATWRQRQT